MNPDDKLPGPSMGARVEVSVCSICGRATDDHDHAFDEQRYDAVEGVQFIAASMVEAPKHCGQHMKFTGPGLIWTCGACGETTNPGFGGVLETVTEAVTAGVKQV